MDPATLLPLILLVAVFYFLIIRPQRRRQQEQQNTLNQLGAGRRVMTASGMYATVTAVEGDEVELEIADGVRVRFVKAAISKVLPEQVPPVDPAFDPIRDDARVDLSEERPPLPGRPEGDTPR